MYPDDKSLGRAFDHDAGSVYRAIAFGRPVAADVLAAEERRRDAQRWAAIWRATHRPGPADPGRWRGRLGALLIRVGTRIQGAAPVAPADLVEAIHQT